MQRKLSILNIILLWGLAATQSCDPDSGERYYVQNGTEATIIVSYTIAHDTVRIQALAGTTELIYEYYDTGATTDLGDDFLHRFDSLWIEYNGNPIKKQWTLRENWSFEITDDKGLSNAGIGNYTFTIISNDL